MVLSVVLVRGGDVPRGIDGGDAEGVARPAGEPAEGVVGRSRCPHLAAAQVEPIAGDADVVGRGRPGERERGLGDHARGEPCRCGRRGGVGGRHWC